MMESAKQRDALVAFAPALALLILASLINYVDRGNLALAAPLLKVEWGLSASQLGILFSAFFWSYTALQFVIGWLVDRFNVNVVIAAGFLVWSLSTAVTGMITGFGLLLVMRIALGAGESVMFPAASKIFARNLPEHARGLANGTLCASMRWGAAVGTFGGGLLIAHLGWRTTFIVIGLISLLWLPAWMRWKPVPMLSGIQRGNASPCQPGDVETPSFAAILGKRSFWGASTGHFCFNYISYFMISWLPYYLVHERHLSISTMAGTAGLLYMVDSLSSVLTGWFTDRKIRRGGDPTVVRKWAMGLGYATAALGLCAWAFSGPQTYLWCLLVCGIGSGAGGAGVFAFGQTLAGPQAAGRWIGLQNGIANLSGVTGPALTGFLLDKTGHFAIAQLITAGVALLGGFAWIFGVDKLEQVRWPAKEKVFS